ncbi:hypothetical protein ACCO45_001673 [Purpureocillium lilacinum]|uniref:Uncharacterized protein n=1 Tax=Purpureocillium lilacinum TaxID=33203 RepID=A0ACC4E7Q7_PURLI
MYLYLRTPESSAATLQAARRRRPAPSLVIHHASAREGSRKKVEPPAAKIARARLRLTVADGLRAAAALLPTAGGLARRVLRLNDG